MKNRNEKKEIIKSFKSKNGIKLIAYKGIWHGAARDEPIKYIEVEETAEFIDSFIENESERKYSSDELLKDRVKELENTLILENFKVGGFREKEYIFKGNGSIKKITEELNLIIKEGEKIGFNEDFGVGKVHYENGKYLVELNVYCNMSFPVGTRDLKEVAKWLKEFHSGESDFGEPYDDGRAMSVAFMKDSESKESREKTIEKMNNKIKETLKNIK